MELGTIIFVLNLSDNSKSQNQRSEFQDPSSLSKKSDSVCEAHERTIAPRGAKRNVVSAANNSSERVKHADLLQQRELRVLHTLWKSAMGHHVPLRSTWCYRKFACSARLKKRIPGILKSQIPNPKSQIPNPKSTHPIIIFSSA